MLGTIIAGVVTYWSTAIDLLIILMLFFAKVKDNIVLALIALNLTKFGQSISRLATNFINNLKSGLRFLYRSKIVVRIILLENQELIVNSQPLLIGMN